MPDVWIQSRGSMLSLSQENIIWIVAFGFCSSCNFVKLCFNSLDYCFNSLDYFLPDSSSDDPQLCVLKVGSQSYSTDVTPLRQSWQDTCSFLMNDIKTEKVGNSTRCLGRVGERQSWVWIRDASRSLLFDWLKSSIKHITGTDFPRIISTQGAIKISYLSPWYQVQ
jgi:hypothetical protein